MYKDTKYEIMRENYEIMKENAETLAKRIDKAIEYIKTVTVDFSYRDRPEYIEYAITEYNDKLLNILEGVDK